MGQGSRQLFSEVPPSSEALCTVLVDWGSVAGELRAEEKMQEKYSGGKSSV